MTLSTRTRSESHGRVCGSGRSFRALRREARGGAGAAVLSRGPARRSSPCRGRSRRGCASRGRARARAARARAAGRARRAAGTARRDPRGPAARAAWPTPLAVSRNAAGIK